MAFESSTLDKSWPEGHSTMDKALACHTGGQGSNPNTTNVYSAPILLHSLSFSLSLSLSLSLSHTHTHTQCLLARAPIEYLSRGRNHCKILAAPSVRQNVREKGGKKNFWQNLQNQDLNPGPFEQVHYLRRNVTEFFNASQMRRNELNIQIYLFLRTAGVFRQAPTS